MYFQISENIVNQHAELSDVVTFIDRVLNETTIEARLRADQLARSSRLDINKIESALEIYAEDGSFDQAEVVECENCLTLAKTETIQAALDQGQAFECTSCDTEMTEQAFSKSAVLTVYYFRVALALRVPEADELGVVDPDPKTKTEQNGHTAKESNMHLTDNEARDITALFNECFKSAQDVVNFAAASAAVSIQGKINTADAETAIQTLITHSHTQELLGEVLVDLAKKFPAKRDRALVFANTIQAKYTAANAEFQTKRKREVDDAPDVQLDQTREKFLERATSLNALIDLKTLGVWIGDAENRICRVRCDGDDYGTGFLISDQLVLTCYHVVESCMPSKKRKYLSICFDDGDGGKEFKADPNWDIPFAKYSERDNKTSTLDPEPEKLDFAIIKLASPVSDRGHFELDAMVPLPDIGEPTLMAGHPGPNPPLQPLRFSMAAPGFEGTTKNGTRLIYKHSSEKGSSGSPVVDRKCRLFGMHHNRGEVGGEYYRNNRGIPIAKIMEFLNESKWADVEEIAALTKS